MRKEHVWNAVLAAIATALLGIVGWLSLSVIHLQNQQAAEDAEKKLRADITDVMNDVDKRLAVIEALMRRDPISPSVLPSPPTTASPNIFSDDPEPSPEPPSPQIPLPRYDLREQQKLPDN